MIKIQKQKLIYFTAVMLGVLPFLYTNCGRSMLASSVASNTSLSVVEDTANKADVKSYEVINTRQYLQSYMNLLDLKRSDITVQADFNKLLTEGRLRAPLLPSKNDLNLTTEISIISQLSLAGAVCDVYVKIKGATSPYFKDRINFANRFDEIEDGRWLDSWKSMFSDIHGRAPSSAEINIIQKFFDENKSAYTTATVKDARFTHNSGVMLCASVLASLESSSF